MSVPSSNSSPPSSGPAMRCVICHPATAELPGELLTSLSRRMARMTICTDIFAALAECCFIQREHAASKAIEAATGVAAPTISAVLVLVHPRHIPDGGGVRLVEASRSYAPSVAIWRYDRGANPKLRAVVEGDVTTGFAITPSSVSLTPPPVSVPAPRPATPEVHIRPVPDIAPKHMNGTSNGAPAAPPLPASHAAPQRTTRVASLLTEDELRMLLSSDPLDSVPLPPRPARGSPRTPHNGGGT